jgi:hypothetical protein
LDSEATFETDLPTNEQEQDQQPTNVPIPGNSTSKYPCLTSLVLHWLSIPSIIAPILQLFLFSLLAKPLDETYQSSHALLHIILAIEARHFSRDEARMNSQSLNFRLALYQVHRLGFGELVDGTFGNAVAGVAAVIVWCL